MVSQPYKSKDFKRVSPVRMPLSRFVTAIEQCKGCLICIYGCSASPSEAHEYMLYKMNRSITPCSKAFFTRGYKFNIDFVQQLEEFFVENKDDKPFLFSQIKILLDMGKNVVIYGEKAPVFADIDTLTDSDKEKIRLYTCD
jgi:hypothetical protein